MVEATLISHDLNKQLKNWYECILENDLDTARKMKNEVLQQVDFSYTNNFSSYLHAKLIELSHYLLENDKVKSANLLSEIEKYEDHFHKKLKFYYYFFRGQFEFLHYRYEPSLKEYKNAEKYLEYIEDSFEIAEYHYKVTKAYYYQRQAIFSLMHLEKATDFYNLEDKKNIVRSADCQMAYGLIYIDVKQYDLAEERLHTAYMYSRKVNDQQLLNRVLHNLGFFYAEQRLSEAALRYLKLIKLDENYEHYTRALFLRFREYCRTGFREEAQNDYKVAMSYLKEYENKEYLYKFQLIKTLYLNKEKADDQLFEESMSYLQQNKLWESVEAYSKLIAKVYSKSNQLKEAVYYYELAQTASHTILEMEVLK